MKVTVIDPKKLPIGAWCTEGQANLLAASLPDNIFPVYNNGPVTMRVLSANEVGGNSSDPDAQAWILEFKENVLSADATNHELVNRQLYCSYNYVKLVQIPAPAKWKYDSATGDLSRGH